MDVSAEQEISNVLGRKHFKVDSSDVVPIHIGPVSVGANFRITVIPGVTLEEKNRWIEVTFEHEYPSTSSWLAEGSEWQANNGEQFSYMP